MRLNRLPPFTWKWKFPKVVQSINTIRSTKYIQTLIIADHSAIRSSLRFYDSPSGTIGFLPCHVFQIKGVNFIHQFCLGWYIPTVNIHFFIQNSYTMWINPWKLNISFYFSPCVFINLVNIGEVTALRWVHLSTKNDYFLSKRNGHHSILLYLRHSHHARTWILYGLQRHDSNDWECFFRISLFMPIWSRNGLSCLFWL